MTQSLSASDSKKVQFSIRSLLILMAVVCVLFAVAVAV